MGRHDLFGAVLENAVKHVTWNSLTRLPRLVDVELTNICNLACKFCPTGQKELKRPKGYMKIELAWDIAEECSKYNIPVRFVRWGEPTMHPNFMGLVRLFKLYDIPLHVNTNGLKLEPDKIVKEEVDSVKISLHSIASYKAFKELVKERGDKPKPYITVAYLEGEQEYGDLEGADRVTRTGVHDLGLTREEIPKCWEVFTRMSVDWDGKVTACCGDYDRKMVVGDLTTPGATLRFLWRSPKYSGYRNLIVNRKWDKLPLCRNCARGCERSDL